MDDAGTDRDGDSLVTTQEFALGTDPCDRDTDDDGLNDNVDPFPLGGDPTNDAPVVVCNDPGLVTPEDTPVEFDLVATDVQGDAITFKITRRPSRGTLLGESAPGTFTPIGSLPHTVVGTRLRYEPEANRADVQFFEFEATDGLLTSPRCRFNIDVQSVNDAPVAVDDILAGFENTPLAINVLANDSDVEGDPLTPIVSTQPSSGSASVLTNNTIEYIPSSAFFGTDTFTYRVSDGALDSSNATLFVTIEPTNAIFWVNAAGGNWSDPLNWSEGRVPVIGDRVLINLAGDYTVVVNVAVDVLALFMDGPGTQVLDINRTLNIVDSFMTGPGSDVQHGSILNVGGAMQIGGSYVWTSSTLNGPGDKVFSDGLSLSGSTVTLSGGGRLLNQGEALIAGGIFMRDGSRIVNEVGSIWDITNDSLIVPSTGGGFFENLGTLRKSGGTGQSYINVPYSGDGDVFVDSGTFWVAEGGATAADFTVATGATLRLGESTPVFTLQSGGTISGGGSLLVNGNVIVEGDAIDLPVTLSGYLTLQATSNTLSSLVQASGTLRVDGTLTVAGPYIWNSGTLSVGEEVAATQGVTISSTATLSGGGRLLNQGEALVAGNIFMLDGSRIVNEVGSTWDVTNDSLIVPSTGGGFFENLGTLRKSGGTGESYINVPYSGDGDVFVDSGTFWVAEGGAVAADFTVAAGATLRLGESTPVFTLQSGGTISGGGSLLVNGNVIVEGDAIDLPVTLSGNLTLQAASTTLSSLVQASGTLRVDGTLTIVSPYVWNSGTLSVGGDVVATQGLTIGSNATLAGGGRLLNQGDALISGNIFLGDGSQIVNEVGSTWDITNDSLIVPSTGGGFFENLGTLRKSGGTGQSYINVPYSGDGDVFVDSGTFWVAEGGAVTADFTVAAGATLRLGESTPVFTLQSGGTISGGGSLRVTGNVVVEDDALDVPVSLESGALIFSGASATITSLTQSGVLNVSGGLFVEGGHEWRSGTISGGGDVTIGQSLTFAGSNSKFLTEGSRLINQGVAVQSGGSLLVRDGSTIVNEAGASWTFTDDSDLNQFSGGGFMVNEGLLQKTGGTAESSVALVYSGGGDVIVNTGRLSLEKGGSSSGEMTVAAGAILAFEGGAALSFTFTGAGQITGAGEVVASTTVIHPLPLIGLSLQVIGSSDMILDSGSTLTSLNIDQGTITANGKVTVNGPFLWNTFGTVGGTNEVIATQGLTLSGGGQTKFVRGTLINQGLTVQDNISFQIPEGGTIINEAGATWERSGGFAFVGAGTFLNQGTFRSLDGTASFSPDLINEGLVDVHLGRISVDGEFTQTATGTLRFEAAGLEARTEYGQVRFNDPAVLAGALEVDISFAAQTGDVLNVIEFLNDPVTGAFVSETYTGFTGPDPVLSIVTGNPNVYRLTFNAPITPIQPRPSAVGEKSRSAIAIRLTVTENGVNWSTGSATGELGYHLVRVDGDGGRTQLNERLLLGGEASYQVEDPRRPAGPVLYELERVSASLDVRVVARVGLAAPLGRPVELVSGAGAPETVIETHGGIASWLVDGQVPGFDVEDITHPERPIPLRVVRLADDQAAYLSWFPERTIRLK